MRSKYFKIHELVPPHIYKRLGKKAWRLIDSRLVESIDQLKKDFPNGTMTINNYKWDGVRQWSGLRTTRSPDYSETSMHSLGSAIDAVFNAYDEEDVRQYIIANPKKYPHIKGIEMGISWLHIDTRNEDKLVKFYPNQQKKVIL